MNVPILKRVPQNKFDSQLNKNKDYFYVSSSKYKDVDLILIYRDDSCFVGDCSLLDKIWSELCSKGDLIGYSQKPVKSHIYAISAGTDIFKDGLFSGIPLTNRHTEPNFQFLGGPVSVRDEFKSKWVMSKVLT